jgi:phosphoglycerate dehydrogenase-like enzyme
MLTKRQTDRDLANTGRGGVVEDEALLTALRRGDLHSAGLDVMIGEPRTDPSDPLLTEPHLVVLPHVDSATEATRAAMVELAAHNIEALLDGRPAPPPVPGPPDLPCSQGAVGAMTSNRPTTPQPQRGVSQPKLEQNTPG